MGALKTFYNEEVRIFMRTEKRAVTHFDVCQLLGRAYLKVQYGEKGFKGFSEEFAVEMQIDNSNLLRDSTVKDMEQNKSLDVHPSDIVPVPELIKKSGTRGTKCGRSKIITSTPNKEELEESINLKRQKVTRKVLDAPGLSGFQTKRREVTKKYDSSSSSSSSNSQSVPVVNDSSDDDLP